MADARILVSETAGFEAQRRLFHAIQVAAALLLVLAIFVPRPFSTIAILLSLAVGLLVLVITYVQGNTAIGELVNRQEKFAQARETQQQVEELFAMTDMLQSAEGHSDAGAVLMSTAQRLLPEFSGSLYVFNNSRDRLDLVKSWNVTSGFSTPEVLLPANCWALKRGKPHINDRSAETLCCMHHIGEAATVEVPMMAKGPCTVCSFWGAKPRIPSSASRR